MILLQLCRYGFVFADQLPVIPDQFLAHQLEAVVLGSKPLLFHSSFRAAGLTGVYEDKNKG